MGALSVKSGETASRPDWRNKQVPTKVRVALWLLAEVGEGVKFSKQQLAEAFPGVAQVDRRMRDLRDHGWVIDTNRTNVSLKPHELLFCKSGEAVWDPSARSRLSRAITARERRYVFERDGQACVRCGRRAGEVRLTLEYLVPLARGGASGPENLVTTCMSCHGGSTVEPDEGDVWSRVQKLSPRDQARLLAWMAMERRPVSPVEQAWELYRRLPLERRSSVLARLGEVIHEEMHFLEEGVEP